MIILPTIPIHSNNLYLCFTINTEDFDTLKHHDMTLMLGKQLTDVKKSENY